jgi:hypothetical protein
MAAQQTKKSSEKSTVQQTKTPVEKKDFIFHKQNFYILFLGVALLIIGYFLMSGGTQPADQFNPNEIYSFQRITLAPITVLLGYGVILFSILWKPNRTEQ